MDSPEGLPLIGSVHPDRTSFAVRGLHQQAAEGHLGRQILLDCLEDGTRSESFKILLCQGQVAKDWGESMMTAQFLFLGV